MDKNILNLFSGNSKELDKMGLNDLTILRKKLETEIAALDDSEPSDEMSVDYERWADTHEELEDYLDEILDRLEEMN